jgi:hypothetical protein
MKTVVLLNLPCILYFKIIKKKNFFFSEMSVELAVLDLPSFLEVVLLHLACVLLDVVDADQCTQTIPRTVVLGITVFYEIGKLWEIDKDVLAFAQCTCSPVSYLAIEHLMTNEACVKFGEA